MAMMLMVVVTRLSSPTSHQWNMAMGCDANGAEY